MNVFNSPVIQTPSAVKPFRGSSAAVSIPHGQKSSDEKPQKLETEVHTIEIRGTEFKPSFLKILKGQTVEWKLK